MNRNLQRLCVGGVMTALLCVAGPLSLPIGPVPISLASLFVCLAGLLLGARDGAMCVSAYLLLGAAGLPVFSGFSGGLQKLMGPTGGFLLGYLACAPICGISRDCLNGRVWSDAALQVLGVCVMYAMGTAWYCFTTHTGPLAALAACVAPFLIPDAGKVVAACLLAKPLRLAAGAAGTKK